MPSNASPKHFRSEFAGFIAVERRPLMAAALAPAMGRIGLQRLINQYRQMSGEGAAAQK
jgi:hypothetical protein